jgi:hypothetical protein
MSSLTTPTNTDLYSIPEYHACLQRLIKQRAINIDLNMPKEEDCTLQNLQDTVELIFNGRLDAMVYQLAHREILKNEELYNQSKLLLKKLSPFQVMNFPQVILYKTLPCPRGDACKNKPREIAPSNQYKDEELECPFFHHEKDRRRLPITRKVEDEFIYKANYDKSKCDPFPDKFSKNYFESMFHPIYYRLFQCKRTHCENSFFCPFFHTKDEKTTWDETFLTYIRKSRDVYTKEKNDNVNEGRPTIKACSLTSTSTTTARSTTTASNDFLPRGYEFLANGAGVTGVTGAGSDRKQSPETQPRTLNNTDKTTRSSTNSSPASSHNDIFEEFSLFPSPRSQPQNSNPQLLTPRSSQPQQQQLRTPPGLGSANLNPFSNYLGCNYSQILAETTGQQQQMADNINNPYGVVGGQVPANRPMNPIISQFFNLNTVQNINNMKLHY